MNQFRVRDNNASRIADMKGRPLFAGDIIVYARKASNEIELHEARVLRFEFHDGGTKSAICKRREDGRIVHLTNPACRILSR